MAKFIFRTSKEPSKKEVNRKFITHRKTRRNILIALYLLQTAVTIWMLI